MSPTWWTRLSRKDQLKYLKAHPRSKLKPKRAPLKRGKKNAKKVTRKRKTVKPSDSTELDNKSAVSAGPVTQSELRKIGDEAVDSYVAEAEKQIPQPEQLNTADKKATLEAIGKHQDEVRDMLNTRLSAEKQRASKTVENMKPKELTRLGFMIKKGVEKQSGKHMLAAAGVVLAKAGLVTVGLGLATAVGITPAIYMLGLFNYRHAINNYIDGPLRNTITDFVSGMYDGMQESLNDITNVRKNVVANEPDTILEDESEDKDVESASAPSHITDVMKSFAILCKKDFYGRYESGLKAKLVWVKANAILGLLYEVEFDMRKLSNLYTRFRLEKDSAQIGRCASRMKELTVIRDKIHEQLALLAATQTVDVTLPIAKQFANALTAKNNAITSGNIVRTYILDKGQLTLCWLIKAENIRATLFLMPRVYVYIACDNPLRIAVSMNNTTTPNSMQTYAAKTRPGTILAEYGLQ